MNIIPYFFQPLEDLVQPSQFISGSQILAPPLQHYLENRSCTLAAVDSHFVHTLIVGKRMDAFSVAFIGIVEVSSFRNEVSQKLLLSPGKRRASNSLLHMMSK
jgi:hypothetical protein